MKYLFIAFIVFVGCKSDSPTNTPVEPVIEHSLSGKWFCVIAFNGNTSIYTMNLKQTDSTISGASYINRHGIVTGKNRYPNLALVIEQPSYGSLHATGFFVNDERIVVQWDFDYYGRSYEFVKQ